MNPIRAFIIAVLAAAFLTAALPGTALCISRVDVTARGKVWVNFQRIDAKTHKKVLGVPYSQSKWASEQGQPVSAGQGYRTDCSGFVSMCLNLRDSWGKPYSTCTRDLGVGGVGPYKGKFLQISKAELLPGDLLLKSTAWKISGTAHVAIFAGWANAAKTSYWALEQTTLSTHDGTILHARRFGEAGYRPYRYAGTTDDYLDCQQPLAGADRYQTAAAAVDAAYPAGTIVPALVVASGESWPDALGGASLSGAMGGPLLLTKRSTLPKSMTSEILRLKPKRVFILGSTSAISDGVAKRIATVCKTSVTRIGGSDRYETAILIARATIAKARADKRTVDTVFVTTGANFPDALAASPISAKTARPVILTRTSSMAGATQASLRALGVRNVVILGGTSSVSSRVEGQLKKARYRVTRLSGTSRYATSVAVARYGAGLKVGLGWQRLGIASGTSFADGLSGGAAQGRGGSLLLLTSRDSMNKTVRSEFVLRRSTVGKVRVFGGPSAVSNSVRAALASALRGQ